MSTEKHNQELTIYEKLQTGEAIPMGIPGYEELPKGWERAAAILVKLNSATTIDDVRKYLGVLIGTEVEPSTTLYTPFSINYGMNLKLGKNIFINQNCQILDLGGVTIEDDVMIGPRVSLLSEDHPVNPKERKALIGKPILIKKGSWIGGSAIILAGVTVGENSVVAAGAVVTKDVPDNTLVAGVPAKIIKSP